MLKKILLVENNVMLAKAEMAMLSETMNFPIEIAHSLKEARQKLEEGDYFVALLKLSLPDAREGQIVDLVAKKIPSVVFTASYEQALMDSVMEKGVLDYYIQDGIEDFKKVVDEVKRFETNRGITILVVDDSVSIRKLIVSILERFNFKILEAADGAEALDVLEANRDIKVVITDYSMPKIDGFKLTKLIRKKYGDDDIAVIGLSAVDMKSISTRFLKHGANDFLKKPFEEGELYVRVIQNIELLEKIELIKSAANKDFLTGIYNRRYFFEVGEKLYQNAVEGRIDLKVAMIDIDNFKKINDTYGHSVGDQVIKGIASLLDCEFNNGDLVARFGGEEFCVLSLNIPDDQTMKIFDDIREKIENIVIRHEDTNVMVTASIGVSAVLGKSLDEMVGFADKMLYHSKKSGRNQVSVH